MHIPIGILITLVSGAFFALGGDGRIPFLFIPGWNAKLWRWLGIGCLIGLTYSILLHSLYPLLAIPAYFVATNFFSYGDKIIWTKWFGKWVSMGLSGLAFGAASFTILSWPWALIQTGIGCALFLLIKLWDDRGYIHNPLVEFLRGACGTLLYFIR